MTGAEESEMRRRFGRRALLLGAGQSVAFALLAGRLYQLQVMDGKRYAPLADDNRISQLGIAPVRGQIYDRAGLELAVNEPALRVSILPSQPDRMRQVLARLSGIVPLTAEEIDRLIERAKRTARTTPLTVRSGLTFEQVAAISLGAPDLPGVETDTEHRRRYAHGTVTGHVVGYVGSVERLAMDDDPMLRLPGAKLGKSGIERGLDETLRGRAGARKFEIDARGRIIRILEETQPVNGRDVFLTIDTKLQSKAVERLSQEVRAAVVALDVETGEVVLMASVPTYDQAELTGPTAATSWHKARASEHNPLINRAIAGLYPPGSTFKMVTVLAAMEAGETTYKERVTCGGSFTFADHTYRCWKRGGHGRVDFSRALRESCDVYFYELARRVGIDRIADMARRLGLGQTYPCGLALQKLGTVPDPIWKRAKYGTVWLGGETILAGIGQGFVLATPLQLAVMTARLATGRAVIPTLHRPDQADAPKPGFPDLGLSAENLEAVRQAMVSVVNQSGGTGVRARLESSDIVIAGKTGTSQVSRTSSEIATADMPWDERDHALFVSYFPAQSPRYAVSAVVEHGGGGGATAAPLVRDIISYILADDPVGRTAHLPAKDADAPLSPAIFGKES